MTPDRAEYPGVHTIRRALGVLLDPESVGPSSRMDWAEEASEALDALLAETDLAVGAMLALAEPEPEPFRQVRPVAEDNARWQAWHDRRLAALTYARKLRASRKETDHG